MREVPGAVVGEGQVHLFVYVWFVTKCFGSNMSMGLCVVGSGFTFVYIFFIGGGCMGAPSHRAHMCNMCGCCVGGLHVIGALGVGGVDMVLKCPTSVHVYCYVVVAICFSRVRQGW